MLGVKINTVDDLNKIMDIVAEDCRSSNERLTTAARPLDVRIIKHKLGSQFVTHKVHPRANHVHQRLVFHQHLDAARALY